MDIDKVKDIESYTDISKLTKQNKNTISFKDIRKDIFTNIFEFFQQG